MDYNFSKTKEEIKRTELWLSAEFSKLRTGRATPSILDGVLVTAYDGKMPIRELAAVSIEEARVLRVAPWDKGVTKEIESAIVASNLGVSVSVDGSGLRVIFPELTTENREKIVKLAKSKLEEARVALRRTRDEVWSKIQADEREGKMSEDEKFRFKEELQKFIDGGNTKLEELTTKKEKEILG